MVFFCLRYFCFVFIETHNPKKSGTLLMKLFLVIGGDGVMLKTLKKYHDYKIPFYGINAMHSHSPEA